VGDGCMSASHWTNFCKAKLKNKTSCSCW
jgi:hypothetical protein